MAAKGTRHQSVRPFCLKSCATIVHLWERAGQRGGLPNNPTPACIAPRSSGDLARLRHRGEAWPCSLVLATASDLGSAFSWMSTPFRRAPAAPDLPRRARASRPLCPPVRPPAPFETHLLENMHLERGGLPIVRHEPGCLEEVRGGQAGKAGVWRGRRGGQHGGSRFGPAQERR